MYTGLDVLLGRRSFSVTTVGGRVCPTQPFSLPASCSPPPPPTVDSTASRVAVVDVVVVPSPFDSADSSPASRSRSRTALGGGTTGKNCCSACRCPGPRLRMTARPAPAIDIDRPSDSVAIDDRPIHRRADFDPHWCCPWRVMERRSTTGPSSCRLRPLLGAAPGESRSGDRRQAHSRVHLLEYRCTQTVINNKYLRLFSTSS